MIVFLTEEEFELAQRIACIRNSKSGQVPNYKQSDKMDDLTTHDRGALVEVAAGRVVGFPPDISFKMHGDNKKPDLYYRGLRLECKGATWDPPILKFDYVTDFVADVAILGYVDGSSKVVLAGCVRRNYFEIHHYIHDFGKGDRACMDAKNMAPIEKLLEYDEK